MTPSQPARRENQRPHIFCPGGKNLEYHVNPNITVGGKAEAKAAFWQNKLTRVVHANHQNQVMSRKAVWSLDLYFGLMFNTFVRLQSLS